MELKVHSCELLLLPHPVLTSCLPVSILDYIPSSPVCPTHCTGKGLTCSQLSPLLAFTFIQQSQFSIHWTRKKTALPSQECHKDMHSKSVRGYMTQHTILNRKCNSILCTKWDVNTFTTLWFPLFLLQLVICKENTTKIALFFLLLLMPIAMTSAVTQKIQSFLLTFFLPF